MKIYPHFATSFIIRCTGYGPELRMNGNYLFLLGLHCQWSLKLKLKLNLRIIAVDAVDIQIGSIALLCIALPGINIFQYFRCSGCIMWPCAASGGRFYATKSWRWFRLNYLQIASPIVDWRRQNSILTIIPSAQRAWHVESSVSYDRKVLDKLFSWSTIHISN